jgi:hypothetical protein
MSFFPGWPNARLKTEQISGDVPGLAYLDRSDSLIKPHWMRNKKPSNLPSVLRRIFMAA